MCFVKYFSVSDQMELSWWHGDYHNIPRWGILDRSEYFEDECCFVSKERRKDDDQSAQTKELRMQNVYQDIREREGVDGTWKT